ncbi:MAG: hypothetical protein OEW32_12870 [Nitrospira sp.]|nr:hypothetical protein [Nitrospira sp.]
MGMVKALKVIGVIWAFLGAANIVLGTYSSSRPGGLPTFGIMFSIALFIIPGLIVYGIGEWNARKLRG